jgi:protein-S-isoprenylcysteine O-methyltransferase Ste14
MEGTHLTQAQLTRTSIVRVGGFIFLMGLILFGSAGSFAYWQAWIYILLWLGVATLTAAYLIRNDPALLERRMRMKERQTVQKKVVFSSLIFIVLFFVLPGLNFRFGWSVTPVWAVIAADLVIILGYWLLYLVFKENSFASRVIEVEKGQKVIDTGPYAKVRHPMYSSVVLIYLASPVALGFWWMVLPGLVIFPILAVRIHNEEELLSRDLPGYETYLQKVKYRLVPRVW